MNHKLKGFLSDPLFLFLVSWGILNIVQAYLTPLNNDEAYYWMYSKYLAWGYFDHPPMIAMMIRIGYSLFHNELGVRLIIVLSQLVTIFLMWKLTSYDQKERKDNILFFFMLIIIIPVWNIYSFLATPDAPLMVFTAIFFIAYREFLADNSWKNTFYLGLSCAALMYSKYHGALLIILVILSNPRLLINRKFYIAGITAILLFLPHMLWQFNNGFPSVKYHLVERVSAFNPRHVPDYLIGQYFYQNPFLIPVLIWLMIKVRAKDLFTRSLYFVTAGFFIFFFISSFRYRVEPQWTNLVSIPMVIILFNNLDRKEWIRKYIKRIAIFLFPAILFLRAASAVDFLPVSFLKKEFHNKKQWVKDIKELAGNRPVVFTNSYQRAAIYTFYSGDLAHTLDNLSYRKTQYDLWDVEEQLHGKQVLYIPHFYDEYYRTQLLKKAMPGRDTIFYRYFNDFQSLQRECVKLREGKFEFARKEVNKIHLTICNPYPYSINFRHKELPVVFQIAFLKNGYMEIKKNLELPADISVLAPGKTIDADFEFTLEDLPPGNYKMAICSETGMLYDTFNSRFREAVVSE